MYAIKTTPLYIILFIKLVKTVSPREGFDIETSPRKDLNLQPADYKSAALPIVLRGH